tara:strand:+ start:8326 stop:8499 length:174 start_codon:yes stop_codon:yes gene_type:complete
MANNKYEFFKNIKLDDDGNVIVVIVDKNGVTTKTSDQYGFFKNVKLTVDGYLQITIE